MTLLARIGWSILSAVLFLALSNNSPLTNLFVFDRDLVLSEHQYWRVITGHLAHWTVFHGLMNAVGLAALIFLVDRIQFVLYATLTLSLMGATGIMLLFFDDVHQYAGFSAVLYGLFGYFILSQSHIHLLLRISMLAIIVFKLALEYFGLLSTESLSLLIASEVATQVHAVAFIFGVIFYLVSSMVFRKA